MIQFQIVFFPTMHIMTSQFCQNFIKQMFLFLVAVMREEKMSKMDR